MDGVANVNGAANNMDQAADAVQPEHGLPNGLSNGEEKPAVNDTTRNVPSGGGLKKNLVSLGSITPGISDVNTAGFTGGRLFRPSVRNNRIRARGPIYAGYTPIFSGCTPVCRFPVETQEDVDQGEMWHRRVACMAKGKPGAADRPVHCICFSRARKMYRKLGCKCLRLRDQRYQD